MGKTPKQFRKVQESKRKERFHDFRSKVKTIIEEHKNNKSELTEADNTSLLLKKIAGLVENRLPHGFKKGDDSNKINNGYLAYVYDILYDPTLSNHMKRGLIC